jgi:hypothetical protein
VKQDRSAYHDKHIPSRPEFTNGSTSVGIVNKQNRLGSIIQVQRIEAVAKVYIVSFRSNDDRRPSKFIVLADNMKSAIKMAWEHGGSDFQSRFDKSTARAQEMKEGALRVL